ncbi:MAG: hypothetical protein J6L00_01880 [Clostridia bacterium]|nr:hypothetical protein [Clostridia bacterium]
MKRRKGCHFLLFLLGGTAYVLIEFCWRRRSHPSMFVVGGICFGIIGKIYVALADKALWVRSSIAALAVTAVEFISGCFLNLHLNCNVWDYKNKRCNLLGQVCLLYTMLWGLLSIPAGALYRYCLLLFSGRAKVRKRARITLR